MEKAHDPKDLDLTASGRGVWLVKVPKYLSEKWSNTRGGSELGRLKISRPKFVGAKQEVLFTLPEATVAGDSIPRDHKFAITKIGNQNLSVLSETGTNTEDSTTTVAITGKVIQRAECRPIAGDRYMELKKKALEMSNKPQMEVKVLDKAVVNYKPKANHAFNREWDLKKKEEGKRSRTDKDKVLEMLYNAFEKHQYYNVKDLVTITKQPITWLKEILKEICNYNMRAPHKNMWELKPEYRHYTAKEDDT
ncbi:unnamed protein product [Owenia fusiformis]|uniref:General transcription factor IIF subunit 2 n=1 Tax=Owenia fusiformis TaxID=6347 RepID=A0A8S4NL92_OWEFU|nr:unnamed protein product [Owenia fusiformis]